MSEPLKVGIVGGGAVVQVAHLPVLRRLRGVTVRALCDTDLPKARAIADRFEVPDAFDDLEDMLGYEALDAVVICTPNHLHEGHILAALGRGLHVLAEKPLATNVASAERIVAAAAASTGVLMVGMNHRYRPDTQIVRSFVQSGELGTIESVRGSWHVFRPSRAQLGWRQRRELSGGGVMLDLGLSVLDLGFWLSGSPAPVRVSASLGPPLDESGVEHSGSAFVRCENGCSIFIDVTWHHIGKGERFGAGVRGSKGSAAISPLAVWKEMNGVPVDVSPTGSVGRENPFTASYRAEWAHFEAMVRGEAARPDLTDHVVLHRVVDAIYESASTGAEVRLPATLRKTAP